METYQLSINNVCDAANTSVIDTTNLISKLQELNQDLKQIEPLHIEIYPFFYFLISLIFL